MAIPQTTTARIWSVAPSAPPEFLAAVAELPEPLGHLCYRRGLRTAEEVLAFLHPDFARDCHDPTQFRDMGKAVQRVFRARDAGERVLVHGDYDADGVCGATVLLDALDGIGCATDAFIPHRAYDGYGFGMPALEYAKSRGIGLIITCDCGIANAATVAVANTAGIDVIVTDHHVCPTDPVLGTPMLPPAYAILHPKLPGETYPYPGLTGGGVAWKFAQALAAHDAVSASPRLPAGFAKWLLDAAAISTVADYGPLIGENRTIVTYGLVVLEKTRRAGLRALYDVAGIRPERITPATIGFQIAPRINAAGRIDHANEALALLRTDDAAEARRLAEKLQATNTERQRLVEVATEEALARVGEVGDRHILIVIGNDWLTGIVGLVATRLRDRFHRPAIALTRAGGRIVGSGRSIEGFHIVEALRAVADLLATFGGHPQACGLTVRGEEDLPLLATRLERYAAERLSPEQFVPRLAIDAELPLDAMTWELVKALEQLAPFGIGNPTPRFLVRNVRIDQAIPMGNGGKHLKLLVRPHKLVVFCYEDICPNVAVGDIVDIVYEVDVNEWNGNREIQMKVVDMRLCS